MAERSGAAGKDRDRSPPPIHDELIGRVIAGRFEILARIARGGMGKVYRARQEPLGREVALKILDPRHTGHDDDFHKRFLLEAETSAKLRHPNTVTIFDYGRTEDDIYFIAMELLEGRPLHHRLREGPLSPPEVIAVGEQICRSLREAHGLGLIHRDLKPANIFLEQHADEDRPHVKVLDFGLVKDLEDAEDMTQTGLFMGSPKYMSPEQATSNPTAARTDVYSLGVCLYQMLTGKVPFERDGSVNLLMAHIQDAPPAFAERAPGLELPAALERVVRRCLEKRPENRFASMNELLQVLKQTAQDLGYRGNGDPGSMSQSMSFTAPAMLQSVSTVAPRPDAQTKRILAAAAGLLVFGALGGLLSVVLGGGDSAADTPAPVAAEASPAAPETAPTVDPAPAAPMLVSLRSDPPGAMVEIEGEEGRRGPTPADFEWAGAEAEPGREVTFRFHLEGHQVFTVTRTLRGERLDVSATLTEVPAAPVAERPEPRATRMTRRRPRPAAMEPAPRMSALDYRLDPYAD
ncbi:MAG: serine/threonine-protein kinase [Myxococcota bacterium]